MYSTKKNITKLEPPIKSSAFCGRYLHYPSLTNKRKCEGGLRLSGKFKSCLLENEPLVSIITVSLNSQSTIEKTILSVLEQTYNNIEYIVVDGASEDKTLDIVSSYSEYIDYYISEPDDGLYHAMNKGISLATGEYILILNSDDWYLESCVQVLVDAKQTSGADFVSALATCVDEDGAFVRNIPYLPYDDSLRFRNPLRHELMLVSSKIYNELGLYDETVKISADFHFIVRLFDAGFRLHEVQKELMCFRVTGVSSTDMSGLISERFTFLTKQFACLSTQDVQILSNDPIRANYLERILPKYLENDKLTRTIKSCIRRIYSCAPDKNTQQRPFISVILYLNNSADVIEAIVQGVLDQSFKSFELLCIDDNSSDNTNRIISRFKNQDNRILVLKNIKSIGEDTCRNEGELYANGLYFFHIETTNILFENTLQLLSSAVEAKKNGAVVPTNSPIYSHSKSVHDFIDVDKALKYNSEMKNTYKNSQNDISSEFSVSKDKSNIFTTWLNKIRKKSAPIKVLTFCTFDSGGAGTGTQRRVAALRKYGVDARIYSLIISSGHGYVDKYELDEPGLDQSKFMDVWQLIRKHAILKAKNTEGFCARELFSTADSLVDFSKIKSLFDSCDIVHFHWVVGMLDYKKLGSMLKSKPIVWTFADMNAFTGGCHYSEGCEEYVNSCKNCKLLGGNSTLAHETWAVKNEAYKQLENLHIVCPSRWMAERARKSSLLKNKSIHYIPNGFPVDKFVPINKARARRRLGLPSDKKLLLFGAEDITNLRKGGDLLKESINIFCSKYPSDDVEVVMFGLNHVDLNLPVHNLGRLYGEYNLSLAYSAVDVFIFPSREDNAPLTVGESLLCGTPVVSFPVGNVPDLIQHKSTGYIAKYLDCVDMAEGIHWALDFSRYAFKCKFFRYFNFYRKVAVKFHAPKVSARRHIELYKKIL